MLQGLGCGVLGVDDRVSVFGHVECGMSDMRCGMWDWVLHVAPRKHTTAWCEECRVEGLMGADHELPSYLVCGFGV